MFLKILPVTAAFFLIANVVIAESNCAHRGSDYLPVGWLENEEN